MERRGEYGPLAHGGTKRDGHNRHQKTVFLSSNLLPRRPSGGGGLDGMRRNVHHGMGRGEAQLLGLRTAQGTLFVGDAQTQARRQHHHSTAQRRQQNDHQTVDVPPQQATQARQGGEPAVPDGHHPPEQHKGKPQKEAAAAEGRPRPAVAGVAAEVRDREPERTKAAGADGPKHDIVPDAGRHSVCRYAVRLRRSG